MEHLVRGAAIYTCHRFCTTGKDISQNRTVVFWYFCLFFFSIQFRTKYNSNDNFNITIIDGLHTVELYIYCIGSIFYLSTLL